jgi:hypothetical protein
MAQNWQNRGTLLHFRGRHPVAQLHLAAARPGILLRRSLLNHVQLQETPLLPQNFLTSVAIPLYNKHTSTGAGSDVSRKIYLSYSWRFAKISPILFFYNVDDKIQREGNI